MGQATSVATAWWSSLKPVTIQWWSTTSATPSEVNLPTEKPQDVFALTVCLTEVVCLPLHSLQPAHPGGEGGAAESILRIEKLLGTSVEFHELDLLDKPGLEKLFEKVREHMEEREELNTDRNMIHEETGLKIKCKRVKVCRKKKRDFIIYQQWLDEGYQSPH